MIRLGPRFIDYGQPVDMSAPLNRGLVSWWQALPQRMGGLTFLDLCNRNHGTLTNGPTWGGARGRPGGWGALSFDGSDDYCEAMAGDYLSAVGTGDFCILAWVKIADSARHDVFIWKTSDGLDDISLYVNASQKVQQYCQINNGTIYQAAGATSVVVNTWARVGLGRSSNTWQIYLNGVVDGSTGDGSTDLSGHSTSRVWLGSNHSAFSPLSDYNLNGLLDDVKIYSRALSTSELLQEYNASRTGYQNELSWRQRYTVFDVGGGAPATTVPVFVHHYRMQGAA